MQFKSEHTSDWYKMVRNGKLRLKMLKHGSDTFQNAKNEHTKVEISPNMVQNGLKIFLQSSEWSINWAKMVQMWFKSLTNKGEKWFKTGQKLFKIG